VRPILGRIPLIAMALTAAGGVLAGCHGGSSPSGSHATETAAAASSGGVQKITVHATDQLRFQPDVIGMHPGKLRLTLVDDGSYPHNISIPSLHFTSTTVSGDPGQTATATTLTLSKPGTYKFVCTFHASAGMRGEIVVT
jgi:plastocyanin